MTYFSVLIASLLYVWLKAKQQLNVTHFKYRRVVPVSYGMAAGEVFIVGFISLTVVSVKASHPSNWWIHPELWTLIACIGTGAWIGCWIAMRQHR